MASHRTTSCQSIMMDLVLYLKWVRSRPKLCTGDCLVYKPLSRPKKTQFLVFMMDPSVNKSAGQTIPYTNATCLFHSINILITWRSGKLAPAMVECMIGLSTSIITCGFIQDVNYVCNIFFNYKP